MTMIFLKAAGLGVLLFLSSAAAPLSNEIESRMISNGDHRLAFNIIPGADPVIVLDAGGGNDSSYWTGFALDLAERTGSKVITYDRAGMGASDEVPGPWDLDAATDDLETGLRELGATRDVVLVSHSIAGEIATFLTIQQPSWFKGVVMVDANVPDFYTVDMVAALSAEYTPMIAELEDAPSTPANRQLIAVAQSFEEVSRAFHRAVWPVSVPVVVIGAEETPFGEAGPVADAWRAAHQSFTTGAPNRKYVLAEQSAHETIVIDSPDIIRQAISDIVEGGH
ncbi:MAG TPA: alpha/beta hydrolase [Pelagibacterium sp.]|nr:alpha/beta hydrolase [Pelagibacterium sp.]|tara:strand:+ start:14896 stop:15738 length:843 start_codon:yes stop_codon:yes gene_type:complete